MRGLTAQVPRAEIKGQVASSIITNRTERRRAQAEAILAPIRVITITTKVVTSIMGKVLAGITIRTTLEPEVASLQISSTVEAKAAAQTTKEELEGVEARRCQRATFAIAAKLRDIISRSALKMETSTTSLSRGAVFPSSKSTGASTT